MPEEVLEGQAAERPLERLQIKKILCPIDFSKHSHRALCYAVSMARHFGSHLVIQHTAGTVEKNIQTQLQQTQLQRSREEIRRLLISAGGDSSEVTILVNEGKVTDRIVETIARERIDLVVMGTHGREDFNRRVGSVTERLIHLAVCPVLVVSRIQNEVSDVDFPERLKTIVLATDFSKQSDRALAYALKWGCEWGAKVVLFHAVKRKASGTQGLVDLFPEYNPYFERQVASAWEKTRGLAARV